MPLNLTASKPVAGTPGDATQIANGFTAVETYVNGNFEPAGIIQGGATTGQVLIWDGTKWAPGTVAVPATNPVYNIPPAVVANSSALTTIVDQIIPGGTLGTTKKLRCAFVGDAFNNGFSPTLQVQILWGGVTILDYTTNTLNGSVSRCLFWIKFTLGASSDGIAGHAADTGHQMLSDGDFRLDQGRALTTGIGFLNGVGTPFAGPNPIAVDSTAAQHLIVKTKWSVANANVDLRMLHGAIEVVG